MEQVRPRKPCAARGFRKGEVRVGLMRVQSPLRGEVWAEAFLSGGQFFSDVAIDIVADGLGGDSQGVHDGFFARRPVGFHHVSVQAQQRCASVAVGVHAPCDGAEGVLGQQGTHFAFQVRLQLGPQPMQHPPSQALAGLQHHVPHKPITNHHVHPVIKQIMALDVADEVDRNPPAQLERLEGEFVAFDLLGADTQDPHPGLALTQDLPGVNAPHNRVLEQMHGPAIDVGPGIQEHKLVLRRRDHRGDTRPVHTRATF
jgi:hypothetical protein